MYTSYNDLTNKVIENENFAGLIQASRSFYISIDMTDTEVACVQSILDHWQVARDWFIKTEFDSKWKISKSKQIRDGLKPRGMLLVNYFKLCERCHSVGSYVDDSIPYKNAGVWFSRIFNELIVLEIDTHINPPRVYNKNIKKSLLDEDRHRVKILRSGRNPFTSEFLNVKAQKPLELQGLEKLIDVALQLNTKDLFKRQYWNPLLKSYSAHIRELASDRWGRGHVDPETGHYRYHQLGKGKTSEKRVIKGNT